MMWTAIFPGRKKIKRLQMKERAQNKSAGISVKAPGNDQEMIRMNKELQDMRLLRARLKESIKKSDRPGNTEQVEFLLKRL